VLEEPLCHGSPQCSHTPASMPAYTLHPWGRTRDGLRRRGSGLIIADLDGVGAGGARSRGRLGRFGMRRGRTGPGGVRHAVRPQAERRQRLRRPEGSQARLHAQVLVGLVHVWSRLAGGCTRATATGMATLGCMLAQYDPDRQQPAAWVGPKHGGSTDRPAMTGAQHLARVGTCCGRAVAQVILQRFRGRRCLESSSTSMNTTELCMWHLHFLALTTSCAGLHVLGKSTNSGRGEQGASPRVLVPPRPCAAA